MPDLLTHALIAFVLCTLLRWRYDWLTPPYVTVGMAGAFIPDIAKAGLVVDDTSVAALLGVPFDWYGIHTLGGAAVCVSIGAVLAARAERGRVLALLSLGAASHLLADALLLTASGYSYPLLWPLLRDAPPTPGVYLSTDVWPSIAAGTIAALSWLAVRRSERVRP